MPKPWFAEAFEWDEVNGAHLAAHHISEVEVEEAFASGATWLKNKKTGSGDWKMVGLTDAGRPVTVILHWDEDRLVLRAITAWDCDQADVTRYLRGKR